MQNQIGSVYTIVNISAEQKPNMVMRSCKLGTSLVLAEVDVVDALGDGDVEPLFEPAGVPVAALSLVTR